MRKKIFWILTTALEVSMILASIFRHLFSNNYALDIYSIVVFILLEAYIMAGFFLKEMFPHRKKMLLVMFVNAVVISDIWFNLTFSHNTLIFIGYLLLSFVLLYFILVLLLRWYELQQEECLWNNGWSWPSHKIWRQWKKSFCF